MQTLMRPGAKKRHAPAEAAMLAAAHGERVGSEPPAPEISPGRLAH